MATFLASLVVFILIAGVMAVGTVVGRRSLRGSCGGAAGGPCVCGAAPGEACQRSDD